MSEIPMRHVVQWTRYCHSAEDADAVAEALARDVLGGEVTRFDLPEPREWEVGA